MTHGLAPAKLDFGGAAIGNRYRTVGDDIARATVAAAWDAGLRHFDTAPHYGFDLVETRLGDALAELDPTGEAFVSTKVGRILRPASGQDLTQARQGFMSPEPVEGAFDYSGDGVRRPFDASVARLRRADAAEVAQAVTLARTPIPPVLWADLIDARLIRADAPVPSPEIA